jgi:hypothetical protein
MASASVPAMAEKVQRMLDMKRKIEKTLDL